MENSVKIEFMNKDGEVSNTPIGDPVIRIYIQPAKLENTHSTVAGSTPTMIYALIDTGADGLYLDETLATNFGYLKQDERRVLGGTATINSWTTPAIFSIGDKPKLYGGSFTIAPLAQNGRTYQALMGTDFIRLCNLLMNYRDNVFTLTPNS